MRALAQEADWTKLEAIIKRKTQTGYAYLGLIFDDLAQTFNRERALALLNQWVHLYGYEIDNNGNFHPTRDGAHLPQFFLDAPRTNRRPGDANSA